MQHQFSTSTSRSQYKHRTSPERVQRHCSTKICPASASNAHVGTKLGPTLAPDFAPLALQHGVIGPMCHWALIRCLPSAHQLWHRLVDRCAQGVSDARGLSCWKFVEFPTVEVVERRASGGWPLCNKVAPRPSHCRASLRDLLGDFSREVQSLTRLPLPGGGSP